MKILSLPIDVIVRFKHKEIPMPYKFRYVDDMGLYREIKVDKIVHSEKIRLVGIGALVYRCQSIIDDVEMTYELRYIIQDCQWELYKM